MLLMNNAKKKKHPLLAVMAGGLAVFGAYSAVAAVKNCVCGKVSCMINKMKNMKKKESGAAICCTDDEE